MKIIDRQESDHVRAEEMEVEFIGGPFDGTRLFLEVVREGPNEIRVLEAPYNRRRQSLPDASMLVGGANDGG